MKYFKVLYASFLFLLVCCKNNSKIENGIYLAKNNEFFYAIELNTSKNEIKIFIRNPYSEGNLAAEEIYNLKLSETENGPKDFKDFNKGNFKTQGNRLIIENLESDMLPSQQVKVLEAIISHDEISINCETLSKHINGNAAPICNSKEIVFIREK